MTLLNPAIVALVIGLLVLDLAAVAWGADSRPTPADDHDGRLQV